MCPSTPTKQSKLETIVMSLKENLNPIYWTGKADYSQFKSDIKKLLTEGKLPKDEYDYIKKNERRVLTKTSLLHLLPEIQKREILENTLKNLAQVIVQRKSASIDVSPADVQEELKEKIKNHMKEVLEPKFGTITDEFNELTYIIKNSFDISLDLEKIANRLLIVKDRLLEKGYSRMLVYDIDRLAGKLSSLSKKATSGEMMSRDELLDVVQQLRFRYENQS